MAIVLLMFGCVCLFEVVNIITLELTDISSLNFLGITTLRYGQKLG